MNRRSDDYIPYGYEIEAAREEAAARVKNIPDPRHEYVATYKVNGNAMTERVVAVNIKEAESHVKQQLAMVGWIPVDLSIVAVGNTNVDVKRI